MTAEVSAGGLSCARAPPTNETAMIASIHIQRNESKTAIRSYFSMDAAAHAERQKADGIASQAQDDFPKLPLSAPQSIDRTDQSHSAGRGKLLRDRTFEPVLRVHPRLGRKEDSAPSGPCRSAPGLRVEAVEQGMAVWDLGTLLWLPSLPSAVIFGSRPIVIGLITLAANCAGARSGVNPHAACDVADVGNGATENPNRARRGKPWIHDKDDPTGYRASVRPYHQLFRERIRTDLEFHNLWS